MSLSEAEVRALGAHLNYHVKMMAELFAWTCGSTRPGRPCSRMLASRRRLFTCGY
ncbi:MAG: hypothetical protein ACLQCU_07065 [Acidimicrobiales bacterium]